MRGARTAALVSYGMTDTFSAEAGRGSILASSGHFRFETVLLCARGTPRQIVSESCVFSPVELVSFSVIGLTPCVCLAFGSRAVESSVSGEGASKPQRDFPRVTAPRREASELRDHSSATGVVVCACSRPHRVRF